MQDTIISICHFIHLVSTVVWIGGLVIFSLFVWPEAKRTVQNPDESRQMFLALQRRFRPIANLALVLLLGTGMVQMSVDEHYEGFMSFGNTWAVAMLLKHLAFGGMVILSILIQFGLTPAIERAALLAIRGQENDLALLLARQDRFMQWSLGLGLAVLVFTAIATAL